MVSFSRNSEESHGKNLYKTGEVKRRTHHIFFVIIERVMNLSYRAGPSRMFHRAWPRTGPAYLQSLFVIKHERAMWRGSTAHLKFTWTRHSLPVGCCYQYNPFPFSNTNTTLVYENVILLFGY